MARRFTRDGQGRWRDERGRFVKAETVKRSHAQTRAAATRQRQARGVYTPREKRIVRDVRRVVREIQFAAGTEFELTATTRGGTPKRR